MSTPTMQALLLIKTTTSFTPGPDTYHPAEITTVPRPSAGEGEVLIKVLSAGFNHRDLFQRQSLYPGTIFSTPSSPSILGADAVGLVITPSHPLSNKYVLLSPSINWSTSPLGPGHEGLPDFGILGSVKQTLGRGTFAEYIVVGDEQVVECPAHFLGRGKEGWAEAAACPLAAVTAYRAVFTKGEVKAGDRVLITGIGGGVALFALQFCLAAGAKVWVTSSSPEKIARAIELGAEGGVNYRDPKWSQALTLLLPKATPTLNVVIDSGGGSALIQAVTRPLVQGGKVVCYGMTSGEDLKIGMGFVLKNCELRSSTMGSLAEFKSSINFIAQHKIKPIVHTLLDGLENAEKAFELMKVGGQFGKIVMTVEKEEKNKL